MGNKNNSTLSFSKVKKDNIKKENTIVFLSTGTSGY
jgi:hypothetical protein